MCVHAINDSVYGYTIELKRAKLSNRASTKERHQLEKMTTTTTDINTNNNNKKKKQQHAFLSYSIQRNPHSIGSTPSNGDVGGTTTKSEGHRNPTKLSLLACSLRNLATLINN